MATARSIHFGACLLLLGLVVFEGWIVGPIVGRQVESLGEDWRTIRLMLARVTLPVVLVSGVWWFVLVAVDMSGSTWATMDWDGVEVVWGSTHFGMLCRWRLVVWVVTCLSFVLMSRRGGAFVFWMSLVTSGLMVGTVASAGHGQIGTPEWAHLLADGVHLLACACWPLGLLPFGLLFRKWKRLEDREGRAALYALTHRFSVMSLASVCVLVVSGIVNSLYLLGRFSNLWTSDYGRLLLIKVIVFVVMVGFGAANLLWFKPRMARGRDDASIWLQRNVWIEIGLMVVVLGIVGWLGTIEPGGSGLGG